MKRAGQRGEADRLEAEQTDFHRRVRQGYLRQAAAEPQRFAVVDASLPLARVKVEIEQALQRLF
jgi:dTMP kinase